MNSTILGFSNSPQNLNASTFTVTDISPLFVSSQDSTILNANDYIYIYGSGFGNDPTNVTININGILGKIVYCIGTQICFTLSGFELKTITRANIEITIGKETVKGEKYFTLSKKNNSVVKGTNKGNFLFFYPTIVPSSNTNNIKSIECDYYQYSNITNYLSDIYDVQKITTGTDISLYVAYGKRNTSGGSNVVYSLSNLIGPTPIPTTTIPTGWIAMGSAVASDYITSFGTNLVPKIMKKYIIGGPTKLFYTNEIKSNSTWTEITPQPFKKLCNYIYTLPYNKGIIAVGCQTTTSVAKKTNSNFYVINGNTSTSITFSPLVNGKNIFDISFNYIYSPDNSILYGVGQSTNSKYSLAISNILNYNKIDGWKMALDSSVIKIGKSIASNNQSTNNMFVLIGENDVNGSIAYSKNPSTTKFTLVTKLVTNIDKNGDETIENFNMKQCNSVFYTNGFFVVCGSEPSFVYSTDGIKWYSSSTGNYRDAQNTFVANKYTTNDIVNNGETTKLIQNKTSDKIPLIIN